MISALPALLPHAAHSPGVSFSFSIVDVQGDLKEVGSVSCSEKSSVWGGGQQERECSFYSTPTFRQSYAWGILTFCCSGQGLKSLLKPPHSEPRPHPLHPSILKSLRKNRLTNFGPFGAIFLKKTDRTTRFNKNVGVWGVSSSYT